MTKIKNYTSKDWIILDVIIKHIIKIFVCQYKENKQNKMMDMSNLQGFYMDETFVFRENKE